MATSVFDEIAQSRFAFPELLKYMENADINVKIGHFNVIAHSNQLNDDLKNKVLVVSKRIEMLVNWLRIDKSILGKLNFIAFPGRRTMGANDAVIAPRHINGGYTYVNGGNIYIFRLEEFPKVAIHEVLHHSIIQERVNNWPQPAITALKDAFRLDDETLFLPAEAVVETWAEIFHCYFLSHELNIPQKTLLELELQHAKSFAACLELQRTKMGLKDAANAYSYIVFRSIFLRDIEAFMDLKRPREYTEFLLKAATAALDTDMPMRMTVLGDL